MTNGGQPHDKDTPVKLPEAGKDTVKTPQVPQQPEDRNE